MSIINVPRFPVQLEISKKTNFLIIWYDHWCGGLGDRICGLVSAIMMAKILQKKLLIKWDHPPIQGVLNLGEYNYYQYLDDPNINLSTELLDTIDQRFKYQNLLSVQPVLQKWEHKNLMLKCNQEIASFLYQNPHVVTGSFEDEIMATYQQIFSVYLRPMGINNILSSLPRPYLGLQLRTGDANMGVGLHQPVKDLQYVLNKISIWIKTTPYQNIYLTTDHPRAKQVLQDLLPQHRLFDTPQSRIHLERSSANTLQLQSLINDLLTLMSADQLLISTYSNFGRLAALMWKPRVAFPMPLYGFNFPLFDIQIIQPKDLFTKHLCSPQAKTISRSASNHGHKTFKHKTATIIHSRRPQLLRGSKRFYYQPSSNVSMGTITKVNKFLKPTLNTGLPHLARKLINRKGIFKRIFKKKIL